MTSIIDNCRTLLVAYKAWTLGHMAMPEDAHPQFLTNEEKLVYFTLPMALNYQRNSYKLWEWALAAYNDPETRRIFSIEKSARASKEDLQQALLKHKVALQPNKHTASWQKIAQTISKERWTIENMLRDINYDFLELQAVIQKKHKAWFPYLSWPKIFHYWSYILGEYGGVKLKNKQFIEVAPDTHVIQCSVKLWVLTEHEAEKLSRDAISERRRKTLEWSGIDPIDMHSPLWFWSRNNFQFEL